ncbi:MAG TPA: cytochrome c biogenesis protein CcdA [Actinomycetota bacterium]|jgi:cytochrome c biogenesis protein CcdA|nr:cytochrome c biogenesis protein CcdA [Actinomycetota bacterium]
MADVIEERSSRRSVLAAAVTMLVLAVAVIAGLMSPTTGGTPVIFVERISSAISNTAPRVGDAWWVYAFALGAVAAFNPCGFALVPAYLGLYLRDDLTQSGLGARVVRSVTVAVVVGATFTALFGAVGAIFEAGSALIVRSLPWIGLGVGVLLVITGGLALSGLPIASSLPQRLAAPIGRGARVTGLRGYAAFGLAYGAASLGCTLPLFLALMGTATTTSRLYGASVIAFALYGAGMATALGVLTVAVGVVSFGILQRLRGFVRIVTTLSAGLLLLSGAYVVYYWLTAGRVLLT